MVIKSFKKILLL